MLTELNLFYLTVVHPRRRELTKLCWIHHLVRYCLQIACLLQALQHLQVIGTKRCWLLHVQHRSTLELQFLHGISTVGKWPNRLVLLHPVDIDCTPLPSTWLLAARWGHNAGLLIESVYVHLCWVHNIPGRSFAVLSLWPDAFGTHRIVAVLWWPPVILNVRWLMVLDRHF